MQRTKNEKNKAMFMVTVMFINYAANCRAWIRYMEKDCGQGNKRLGVKALLTAVCYVAEGEMGGLKICLDFLPCVSLPKCPESQERDFK